MRNGSQTKPIALKYPDKLYVGTFERSSQFEAHSIQPDMVLMLERPGAEDVHKSIHMHIHFGLFADILRELASTRPHSEGRPHASRSSSCKR